MGWGVWVGSVIYESHVGNVVVAVGVADGGIVGERVTVAVGRAVSVGGRVGVGVGSAVIVQAEITSRMAVAQIVQKESRCICVSWPSDESDGYETRNPLKRVSD